MPLRQGPAVKDVIDHISKERSSPMRGPSSKKYDYLREKSKSNSQEIFGEETEQQSYHENPFKTSQNFYKVPSDTQNRRLRQSPKKEYANSTTGFTKAK